MRPGSGYPFPDPFDPGEYSCFRVYIPKHSVYYSAFWTAYEFFCGWIAWARDPLHTGAKVAALWRIGFDRARKEFDASKGECSLAITSIRTNPLNPQEVQAQFDGSDAWVPVLDLSCSGSGGVGSSGAPCLPPMRQGADGSIQSYNPQTGTWSDTSNGAPPETTPELPGKYPDNPDGACIAAANYEARLKKMLHIILDTASTGEVWGEASATVLPFVAAIFGIIAPAIDFLFGLFADILGSSTGVTQARKDAENDVSFLCELSQMYLPDGSTTQTRVDQCVTALRAAYTAEPDASKAWWLNHAADLISIFKVEGAIRAANSWGITSADCSACEWSGLIDFQKSKGPFDVYPIPMFANPPMGYGAYVNGVGWQTRKVVGPHQTLRQCFASAFIHPFHLTYARITGSTQFADKQPSDPPAYNCKFFMEVGNSWNFGGIVGDGGITDAAGAPRDYSSVISVDNSVLSIAMSVEHDGTDPGFGTFTMSQFYFRGTGPIPPELQEFIGLG